MSRKLLLLVLLALLIGTLNLASRVEKAKATGTIYIRADGSIDPPDAPISSFDNVTYTLTGNIATDADGIVVERDNIVVDGAGYTVQGAGAAAPLGSGKGIYLSYRSNVIIKNTNIKRFVIGIALQGSNNNSISRNNITENYLIGIHSLSLSSNNIVSGNNITNNGYGISLSSSNNIVSKNTITNNGLYGITLGGDDPSINNTISENTMTNNNYNIYFVGGSDNTISRNNIANNTYGIFFAPSDNNTISENTITSNEYGIRLNFASNNKFYHNSFIDNTIQVVPHLVSIWDDGYPSGGNYWSDYNGTDANYDGIGDTPYTIDADNTDNYPLMTPYAIPEFPSFLVLPILMVATLFVVLALRREYLIEVNGGLK
jgi:parallel beta-helix repeat protein